MAHDVDEMFFSDLDRNRLPRHVAVIMDGNGRWARQRKLERIMGHNKGIDAVRDTVRACRKLGIGYLTLYAFSQENWNRPKREIEALFTLLKKFLRKELPEIEKNDIRLCAIGQLERLPQDVQDDIADAIERTRNNNAMTLTVALSYSGRDELTAAARRIAQAAVEGKLEPEKIDPQTVASFLDTAGMPDPDLLIRTSGERRVSNYLLWQIAYTEIYVTDALWPDFNNEEFHKALVDYAGRERRFGKTSEQLNGSA